MAKLKTEFDLYRSFGMEKRGWTASASISPCNQGEGLLIFTVMNHGANAVEEKVVVNAAMPPKDIERFAVNILKIIKSKRLKK